MKDSHELALEWEALNPQRALELNDMLDACASVQEKRALYQTFTKEERNGLMPEYGRRANNREVPIGSLVHGRCSDAINGHFFHFTQWSGKSSLHGVHLGTALVLGAPHHGSTLRYVLLQPMWVDREGHKVLFAEVHINDIKVIE